MISAARIAACAAVLSTSSAAIHAAPQVDQTKAMAKALKRHKKPHEAVIIEAATHELARKSDRETLLEEVEAFLLEHLGKGAQANAEQPS